MYKLSAITVLLFYSSGCCSFDYTWRVSYTTKDQVTVTVAGCRNRVELSLDKRE